MSPDGLQWGILAVSAFLIGMSKTGFQGINTPTIPLLAFAFGAKESTGLILPMLCIADVIAVLRYRRNTRWKYILKLIPFSVAGFFIAVFVERFIPSGQFRYLMAGCILFGLGVMYWSDRRKDRTEMTTKPWYGPFFGLLGGFTTMIGNAAGPIMAVYLLSMKLPKFAFVGTSAWFFLIVNYLKLPLQIFVWNNITPDSLLLDAVMIPAIGLGAAVGIVLVKRMPESSYRKMIVGLTILATCMLLI